MPDDDGVVVDVVGAIEAVADGLTVGDAEDGVGLTEADAIDLVIITDVAGTEGVTVAFGAAGDTDADGNIEIVVDVVAAVRLMITIKQKIQFVRVFIFSQYLVVCFEFYIKKYVIIKDIYVYISVKLKIFKTCAFFNNVNTTLRRLI